VNTCDRFRPLLSRFAEGEADPEEALGVARHLAACTACKIVLARERRLHEALEGLGDSVSVDDEFSRLVMAALPAGPPPAASRSPRRGLRLAGLVAIGSLGGAVALRLLGLGAGAETLRLASRLDIESGSHVLEGLGRLAGAAAALLVRIATGIPSQWLPSGASIGLGLAPLLAAGGLLAGATLLAVTTWAVGRKPRGTRYPSTSDGDGPAE
jgi:anti-sigma factor RsiW